MSSTMLNVKDTRRNKTHMVCTRTKHMFLEARKNTNKTIISYDKCFEKYTQEEVEVEKTREQTSLVRLVWEKPVYKEEKEMCSESRRSRYKGPEARKNERKICMAGA